MMSDIQRTEYLRICIDDDWNELSALTGSEIDHVSGGRLFPAIAYRIAGSSPLTARTVMEDSLGRPGRFYREHQ